MPRSSARGSRDASRPRQGGVVRARARVCGLRWHCHSALRQVCGAAANSYEFNTPQLLAYVQTRRESSLTPALASVRAESGAGGSPNPRSTSPRLNLGAGDAATPQNVRAPLSRAWPSRQAVQLARAVSASAAVLSTHGGHGAGRAMCCCGVHLECVACAHVRVCPARVRMRLRSPLGSRRAPPAR